MRLLHKNSVSGARPLKASETNRQTTECNACVDSLKTGKRANSLISGEFLVSRSSHFYKRAFPEAVCYLNQLELCSSDLVWWG